MSSQAFAGRRPFPDSRTGPLNMTGTFFLALESSIRVSPIWSSCSEP
jgi:hypothetical protein